MKAKKILATVMLSLAAMTVSSNVSAEQAAAEEYRQMFRDGNFYVEYQIFYNVGNHNSKSANTILAGQDGKRLYRGRYDSVLSITEKISKIYTDISLDQRAMAFKTISNKNYPDILYQDGKYYRLVATAGKSKFFSFSGSNTKLSFIVLPEDQLNSPVLDPDEEWQYIREDLALPDELAIFCWNEPFRDDAFNLPAPVYDSSSKKTVENKQYDCDRYINEIKNLAGDVAAQEIYDMLYENGKLVLIQKYLKHNGKENFVREFRIKKITSAVPENTFKIGKEIKVYAAANGDMDDMLEHRIEVETLGGK